MTVCRISFFDGNANSELEFLLCLAFLLSLIAALVFAVFLSHGPDLDWLMGLAAGATVGLFWVATSFGISYLFEGKSLKLWLINAGYHTMQFTLYGLVIGLF